ncbi:MAG: hypothetical protein MJ092_07790, partial [Lachnospiraceae bacterium]|nr:hypothetical protein [Lachnospiraceae bacterium]
MKERISRYAGTQICGINISKEHKENSKKQNRRKLRKVVIWESFLLQLTKLTMIYKSVLVDRHFGFDAEKQQWYDGRRAVDSEAPLTFLIRAFKSCGVPDAGLKA